MFHIKDRNIIEVVFGLVSFVAGLIIILESLWYIWAYNSTGILYFFMFPMTILLSYLLVGISLTFSGYKILKNNKEMGIFSKISGLYLLMLPINLNITELIKNEWYEISILQIGCAIFGLTLISYFSIKKYKTKNHNRKLGHFFIIGVIAFLSIDFLFWNWSYL